MREQPQLPPQAQQALHTRYNPQHARTRLKLMTQGEKDQLEAARERLGWPTILSLAMKYYPLYPCRKWWQKALARCSHYKARTATLNIIYLLRTIESVKQWSLTRAYQSTRETVNRLTQRYKDKEGNRLTHHDQSGIVNIPQDAGRMNTFMARAASAGGSL